MAAGLFLWPMRPRPPNFLIFMTDQQRGDVILDRAWNRAKTPVLDACRREGVTFTRAFCPSPHCCPSRATFMTGWYPSRHGVWNNVNVGNALSRGPWPGVPFWSRALAEAGYRLHFSGKWHVSDHEGPEAYGWETGLVTAAPRRPPVSGPDTYEWMWYRERSVVPSDVTGLTRGEGEILRPGYLAYRHYGVSDRPFGDADVVASGADAVRCLAEKRDPWCVFVGTLGPHDPYLAPASFLSQYDPAAIRLPPNFEDAMEDRPALYRRMRRVFAQLGPQEHREAIRHYLAFCSYQDALFGQLLEALQRTGQADQTVVIYVSDHGDYMAEHGLWCKGLPCFLPAYHVPLVIRWPAGIQAKGCEVDAWVSLADLAPTILEIAGCAEQWDGRRGAGRSLVPFLRRETPAGWRDALLTQTNGNELYGIQRAIFTRDWCFVWNGFDEDELYDLRSDPWQTRNLARDPTQAPVIRRLMTRIWRHAYEQDDVCINPYIAVGLAPVGPGVVFETPDAGE